MRFGSRIEERFGIGSRGGQSTIGFVNIFYYSNNLGKELNSKDYVTLLSKLHLVSEETYVDPRIDRAILLLRHLI